MLIAIYTDVFSTSCKDEAAFGTVNPYCFPQVVDLDLTCQVANASAVLLSLPRGFLYSFHHGRQ